MFYCQLNHQECFTLYLILSKVNNNNLMSSSQQSGPVGASGASQFALRSILAQYLSDEHQDVFINFMISFTVWNVLNIIVMNLKLKDAHLPRNDWLDLRNRIVSFVHGTTVLFLSGYNTYFAHSQCGEKNTQFEMFILQFSNGYFAYDLLAMAYLGILDRSMTIHHLICMGGLSGGLLTGYSADILIGAIFLTEISNPAMHIRVILRLLGLRYTKAYETSEITYMILYMFGRVFLGLPVLYRTWMCPSNHIIVKFMGTGLIAQSLKFIYQMVFILKARANEYAERKAKNVKLRWLDPLSKEEVAKIDAYNKKNAKKQHVP